MTSLCACITGVGGQDGSYLAELLLSKGYHVFGMIRRNSTDTSCNRIKHITSNPMFHVLYGDVTDITSVIKLLSAAWKQRGESTMSLEVYNLAAQSHVQVSFDVPVYTTHADAIGIVNVMEAVLQLGYKDHTRIYQASTSELYGSAAAPQNEKTPFEPRSPYAISKLYAYWMVRNYREAYNMFVVNGILFNHESERRSEEFVSRKVTCAVAAYYKHKTSVLRIGNLYAKRDWGYAPEYVEGMWQMLQRDLPDDYVLATGICHTVKYLIETAFKVIDVSVRWEGSGEDEKGYDAVTGNLVVEIDPFYFRKTEVYDLRGDASYTKTIIGWEQKTSFEDMISIMVQHDILKLQ